MKDEVQWTPLFGGTGGSAESWRAQNPQLFPSDESLRHYLREHKHELVKEGAVVFHLGRWRATEKMAPTVAKIAQRAARREALV